MADTFTPVSFVADELLTSTKMNRLAANMAAFHNGEGLGDGIIVSRHIAESQITGDKTSSYRVRHQADETNTSQKSVILQSGWGQILGNGSANMSKIIKLPTPVSKILSVNISFIGYKSGGTFATDIAEFNTKIGVGIFAEVIKMTPEQFTVELSSTGYFGPAYHGFSWSVQAIAS